jgi:hypothetical protein
MVRLAIHHPANATSAAAMKAILKSGKDIDREAWLAFLAHSPEAAIYVHPAYLDLIAAGWQAIEVWRDQHLLAIMPLHLKQKAGYTYALQPSFSQHWGVVFAGGELGNAYKTYSHRRKVIKAIVAGIPSEIKWFLYGFAPEFDYPHPFHWDGYTLGTRYTYRLDLSAGYAATEKNFGNDTRYDIRKAIGQKIVVQASDDWQQLDRLIEANQNSGKVLLQGAERETFSRLAPFLLEAGLGILYFAIDESQSVIGAGLFGHFAGKTCYLMSAQAPQASSAGAMTLLLAKAIEDAVQNSVIFDFEGSMIEGIEGFFRGFGGKPVPYLMIEKNQLPLPVRWIRKLR